MKILVINSGSSSLKFKLFQKKKTLTSIAEGMVDGIGLQTCKFHLKSDEKNIGLKRKIKDHQEAIDLLLENLQNTPFLDNLKEIKIVGHRVVHGGEKYFSPTKVNAQVLKELEKISDLAPLHNPPNLLGIKIFKKLMPRTPQVAVFDTGFHQTLPPKAFLYGLKYNLYSKAKVRKYGFHGTSHKYVTNQAFKALNKKKALTISCHLGNGSSITAAKDGQSIDTTMGLTPLAGPMMGTRAGSFDPAIIFYLHQKLKLSLEEIEELVVHKSGLAGFTGGSSDMRIIHKKAKKGDKKAILALEMLAYQIAKYIGSYIVALGGLDALIFTGGIGENAYYLRTQICDYLKHQGLKLNQNANQKNALTISRKDSSFAVMVIPTNEELQIAKEALATI